MLGEDDALCLEEVERATHGALSDAVPLSQLSFAGQLRTRLQLAGLNRGAKVIRDLLERGSVTGRVKCRHRGSPKLLYMTTRVTPDQELNRPLPRHSVSVVAAVVREDGRVLAIRRDDNGEWQPPGGILELEETIEAGVCRETLEETGFQVEPECLTGVYKNMPRGIVALTFRCRVVGGAKRLSDETTAVDWLTTDEVRERMSEAHGIRLLDALSGPWPHVRAHDGIRLLPRG